jgi:inorganic triphosphatase YgiF
MLSAGALPPVNQTGREIELKFLVSEAGFKAAQQWDRLDHTRRRPPARRLHSVYFDTADGDLARNGMILRIRTQNKRFVMTAKWADSGSTFERGEVEVVVPSEAPDFTRLGGDIAEMIAALVQDRELLPCYATDVKRITHLVRSGASQIEVAFDAGRIIAGEKTLAVREVELELKEGEPAELYRLGSALAAAYPVRIGAMSKAERGALLQADERPAVVRAMPGLSGAPSVDEAIGTVINRCCNQFIGNWPAFESGDGVAAVHQMRVAMRRLRSAIGILQRAFPNAEFSAFHTQARDMATAMGEAREWDVFIALLRGGPMAAFAQEPGFAVILADAQARREAGYTHVAALLQSPETTSFVLAMQSFVARRGWRNSVSDEALVRLTAPAKAFAAASLERLHRKLLRSGKHLDKLSPHERHEFRKDLKKLRYAADLFGGLFEDRRAVKAFARATAHLQEELGIFNDLIGAQAMAARVETAGDPDACRAVGIVMGWCGHGACVDDAGLRKAWKDFRQTRLFA